MRFLFGYVVPHEIRDLFREGADLLLNVDEHTAPIPWELFLVDRDNRAGAPVSQLSMVRQFSDGTAGYRIQSTVANRRALVIGDPMAPRDRFVQPLPQARVEADKVAQWLRDQDYDVVQVPHGSSAEAIFSAVGAGPYEIVHIAGHGEYYPDEPDKSGVVLENGQVLGANEIAAAERPPVLLFLNCCSLAKVDRPQFALTASIAQRSIELGVGAIVAAGWPVIDSAAAAFAEKFYAALLAGQALAEAVSRGRLAAFRSYTTGNTWAAYQCYGDPELVLPSRAASDTWIDASAKHRCDDRDEIMFFASPREAEDELRRVYATLTRLGDTELERDRMLRHMNRLDRSLLHDMRTGPFMFWMAEAWTLLGRLNEAASAYEEAWQYDDCPKAVGRKIEDLQRRRGEHDAPPDSEPDAEPPPSDPGGDDGDTPVGEAKKKKKKRAKKKRVKRKRGSKGRAPFELPTQLDAAAASKRWLEEHVKSLEQRQDTDRVARVRLATLEFLSGKSSDPQRLLSDVRRSERMQRRRVSHAEMVFKPELALLEYAAEASKDPFEEGYSRELCRTAHGATEGVVSHAGAGRRAGAGCLCQLEERPNRCGRARCVAAGCAPSRWRRTITARFARWSSKPSVCWSLRSASTIRTRENGTAAPSAMGVLSARRSPCSKGPRTRRGRASISR